MIAFEGANNFWISSILDTIVQYYYPGNTTIVVYSREVGVAMKSFATLMLSLTRSRPQVAKQSQKQPQQKNLYVLSFITSYVLI